MTMGGKMLPPVPCPAPPAPLPENEPPALRCFRCSKEVPSFDSCFRCGNSASITEIIANATKMQKEAKKAGKQFVLIVDSLQCLDDDKYSSGKITSGTAIRCLQEITDFCKETGAIGICINQVNKAGKMAGSNKLKHMVDSMMHLSVEEKDEDFKGCRIKETKKNRYGG